MRAKQERLKVWWICDESKENDWAMRRDCNRVQARDYPPLLLAVTHDSEKSVFQSLGQKMLSKLLGTAGPEGKKRKVVTL